jgi:hypothetical protein
VRAIGLLLVVGCTAPRVVVLPEDAASDGSSVDAAVCRSKVKAPEGGTCAGDDEDHDCTPDPCDDCPNVPQEPKAASEGDAIAGEACVHPRFGTVTRRSFFDPFATVDAWVSPPSNETLHAKNGSLFLGELGSRLAYAAATASDGAVVATAVFVVPDGGAAMGIALRYSPETREGWVCQLEGNTVRLATLRCSVDSTCATEELRDAMGNPVEKFLSLPLWSGRILLRAAVATSGSGAVLECQAFHAPTITEVNGTLQSTSTSTTVRFEVASPIHASGVVGLYASQRQIEVESIDVLASP